MKIAISGATGFVGQALVQSLKDHHELVCLSRSARSTPPGSSITWKQCDFFSLLDAEKALEGVHTAFYLVHSMLPSARLTQGSFEDFDLIAADGFARAARKQGVHHIVYLGGLLPTYRPLSRHLASRLEVEKALASHSTPVTTLRAGLIVGSDGSSFQMLVRLVQRLPAMVCPKWTESLTQPIALSDIVDLLSFCVEKPELYGRVFDVGGPEVLSYRDMILSTAKAMGVRRPLFKFPLFTPGLSRLWVTLVTGAPRDLVGPLVQSLRHDMVAESLELQTLAGIPGKTFQTALRESLASNGHQKKNQPRAFQKAARNDDPDVRSIQRLPLPHGKNAYWVSEEYMRWLPRFFPFLLRTQCDADGFCRISVRGLGICLLALELSRSRSTPDRALFYVRGGVLARTHGRGRLEFRQVLDQWCLAALHDFHPRLPWYLYKWTQALLHVWVMKAFGRHLKRCLPGVSLGTSSINEAR
jgi:uncharacterized protein YbjT (DUF2867 family)